MLRSNLRQRRQGWAAVYYVPKEFQKVVGKREIVRGLGTRDLREAAKRKHAVLAEIAKEIAQLDDLTSEALEVAKVFDGSGDGILERAMQIEDRQGEAAAVRYYKTATRQLLPVSVALDMWMAEADGITDGTKLKYRGHVQAFVEWSSDVDVNKCSPSAPMGADGEHVPEIF